MEINNNTANMNAEPVSAANTLIRTEADEVLGAGLPLPKPNGVSSTMTEIIDYEAPDGILDVDVPQSIPNVVPPMMTAEMKQKLRDRGFTDDEINGIAQGETFVHAVESNLVRLGYTSEQIKNMNPSEKGRIIRAGTRAPRTIDAETPAVMEPDSDTKSDEHAETPLGETEQFLEAMAGPRAQITFQTADDDKKRKDRSLARVLHGTHKQHASTLSKLNKRGAAVYFAVNKTDGDGREEKNIVGPPRALFADLDIDGSAKLAAVLNCKRPPDIVIESSPNKFHVYWINDGTVGREQFTALQQKIAAKVGGDNVSDLPRVMRMPGYLHQKDPANPFTTRIVSIKRPPVGGNLRADIEALTADVDAQGDTRSTAKPAEPPKPREHCRAKEWVNQEARRQPLVWGPYCFPDGWQSPRGGSKWRVSPDALGRACEEDLEIAAKGKGACDFAQKWKPEDHTYYIPTELVKAFFCKTDDNATVATRDDLELVTEWDEKWAPIGGNLSDDDACRVVADALGMDWDAEIAKDEEWEWPTEGETSIAFSEDALALQFADEHAEKARFVASWSQWLWRDKSRWAADETSRAFDVVRKICRAAAKSANKAGMQRILASSKTVAAVERLAKSDRRIAATVEQWDRDPWLLNTPAGTVDLKTGQMREHRGEDCITKVTATPPEGACPQWRAFIARITAGNVDLADFLQRMLGYALTGLTHEQCLFFCYGRGANGKSVLLNTASNILADYHTTAPIATFTASATERHPAELATLRGARLVTSIETEEGRRWDEAKIKSLTGGDKISARFMRQDFFEYIPQFKLILAGNHKPELRTVDEAIRRRIHLVPFSVTIPQNERDPNLVERLKEEWPGILQWMIEGCLEWQRSGLKPPSAVRDATAEYLESEDAVATWLADRCTRNLDFWESSTTLFISWSGWAKTAGEPIGSQKAFSQKLAERDGLRFSRTNKGSGFYGLKIGTEEAWCRGS